MFWVAHGVHLALVVGGAIGVLVLLGPEAERRVRVHQLRTVANADRLIEIATQRAWVTYAAGRPVPRAASMRLGALFGLVCTATGVLAVRLAGASWPGLRLSAGTFVATSAIGIWVYRRRRKARTIVFVAVLVELAAHAALVLIPVLSALQQSSSLTRSFAAALFCHSAGGGPSTTVVRAAAARLGVAIPQPPATSGFLSPTATALAAGLLLATGLFALYLRSSAVPARPVTS